MPAVGAGALLATEHPVHCCQERPLRKDTGEESCHDGVPQPVDNAGPTPSQGSHRRVEDLARGTEPADNRALVGDLEERGVCGAGAYGQDTDAVPPRLPPERLGEGEHEGLGGPVDGHVGHWLEGCGGGDVDDRAAPALAHGRQVSGRQAHHRKTVEAHLLLQALGGVVGDVLPSAEAGVVDQDVNVQTSAVGLVPQPLGGVRLGQVIQVFYLLRLCLFYLLLF